MPTSGSPRGTRTTDGEVRRWLAERLEADPPGPAADEAPTHPGGRVAPGRGGTRWSSADATSPGEDTSDPETEVADGSLEDERDPRTVRVHRMPVSFIGESVFDPETARADGWSLPEGPLDEVPLRTPTPQATPRAAFRPSRPPPPPVRPPEPPSLPSDTWLGDGGVEPVQLLGAVVVGTVIGLFGVFALFAWMA